MPPANHCCDAAQQTADEAGNPAIFTQFYMLLAQLNQSASSTQ
jgi:hypothetical protein